MSDTIQADPKMIETFHLMFDNFPESAQLAHRSKTIVAVNPACRARGREVGMICAKHGPPETHKGCLAAKAVKEQKAAWKLGEPARPNGRKPVIYWVPVPGYPDFFIHFGTGYMVDQAEE